MAFPQALLWVDLETTGLDFKLDRILEVAVIITDFDLKPYAGYEEAIKLTAEAATRIKGNEYVRKMHSDEGSGLIRAAHGSTVTLADAEREIIEVIKEKTSFGHGEFMLAGSGVAHFDRHLIDIYMPTLAKYLAYYSFDIGVFRRISKIFNGGQEVVPAVQASFKDGVKKHRALADVQAHLEEANAFRGWLRAAEGKS